MEEKKQSRHRNTLIALSFGYFIDQGAAQSMGVLQNSILRYFPGMTPSLFGLMETLRTVLQTISAPVWGYASDKYSRKRILIIATMLWGLWTILVGMSPNFETLIIMRAISGFGLGCIMPATFSLVADHFPQARRGMAMGFIGLMQLLGTIAGVLALGFATGGDAWRWGFVGLG
ncbi:MAG: MFS transporter, partial [Chloroflexota bacterium]